MQLTNLAYQDTSSIAEQPLPRLLARFAALLIAAAAVLCPAALGQPDEAAVIRSIDAAVHNRNDAILSYTVTEHYAVFRGQDETRPAAEMTVKTTYHQNAGKDYVILSESGSELIRKFGLKPLLDNERTINQPANRERSFFTSDNYQMQLKPGGAQQDLQKINGRDCLALSISPRRKAPNLIHGTIWVDAADYSIVRIEGTGSKNPTLVSGPAHMIREYAKVNGFAEATHASAVSSSFLFGRTKVTIDYSDYQLQVKPSR